MGLVRRFAGRVFRRFTGGLPDEVATAPESPRPAPPAAPNPGPVATNLATIDCGAQELRERLGAGEHIVVVDVRTDGEVAGGVIPGARHIPLHQLDTRWEELRDADEIVCYCAAGMRSLKAARILRSNGLINATSLEGGIGAWRSVGGDIVALGN
ncbi:MAG: rhodanese-like domain-containing protein [Alphaproteobacteria bacterium]|nr:rhodanese-like domain-containing protein [Alphaproteobacteria bacterium]